MASTKSDFVLYIESRTMDIISDYPKLDYLRDIWYEIKDEMDSFRDEYGVKKGKAMTEKEWEGKVSSIINKRIEKVAFEQNPAIYKILGLECPTFFKGDAPIVVIFEKKKSMAIPLLEKYHAAYYWSTGQVTTKDTSYIADYLSSTRYTKGHVIVMTDYDPAGESLYRSFEDRLRLFTKVELEVTWVWNEYYKIPWKYNQYKLADNDTNRKWIDKGNTHGVEFNSPKNIALGIMDELEATLESCIDPRMYAYIAFNQWRWNAIKARASNDVHLGEMRITESKIERKIAHRMHRHKQAVSCLSPAFKKGKAPLDYEVLIPKKDGILFYEDERYINELMRHGNPYDRKRI